MAEIRLSKLTKQFSIGLARLVEFLNEKGANVDMNPNAKISDEYLPALEAKFGEDLKLKKDSEKVTIKLKEIIEMGSKKKPSHEEEDAPEREVVIKSNVLNAEPVKAAPAVEEKAAPVVEEKPAPVVEESPVVEHPVVKEESSEKSGLKIVDKIDLSKFEKKPTVVEEKPVEVEPVAEPVSTPTPVETPAAPEIKEVLEEVKAEPVLQETAVAEKRPEPREMKVEVEKLAGPKVVDKIDLSQFDKKKNNKKRERIGKGGSQKVDVTKVEADSKSGKKDKNKNNNNNNAGQKDQRRPDQQNAGKNGKKNRRDRGGDKFKPMTEAEQEEMQKEIQKQIKETYARMNENKKGNFGAKHRKEKRELASQRMQEEMEMQDFNMFWKIKSIRKKAV